MRTFHFFHLIFLALLFSCNDTPNHTVETETESSEYVGPAEPLIVDSEAIGIEYDSKVPQSPWILFELRNSNVEKKGADSFSYRSDNSFVWNILFYNSQTQEKHLLRDRPAMRILNYKSLDAYSSNDRSQTSIALSHPFNNVSLYQIQEEDANQNGQFDDADPSFLYISEPNGDDFRKISPDSYHVSRYVYNEESNYILMMLFSYAKTEGKVQYSAQSQPYIYALDSLSRTGFLLDKNEFQQLKNLQPK